MKIFIRLGIFWISIPEYLNHYTNIQHKEDKKNYRAWTRVVSFPEKYNVGNFPEFFRKNSGNFPYMESSINHTFVKNDVIYAAIVCFPATARCVCRLRVHKVSNQNLVSKHQRMNAISALLCCSCISILWNFLPKTSRKFFSELFRKSTVIFPEISGKIPQEISELTTLAWTVQS